MIGRRIKQLKVNWVLSIMGGSLAIVGYCSTFTTLRQYITNPRNSSCIHEGLESSENIYSLAAGLYNAGSIIGALFVTFSTKALGVYSISIISLLSHVIGYLIYGVAVTGWMVIIARIFIGFQLSSTIAIIVAYFGTSSKEYNRLALVLYGKENVRLKKTLITACSVVISSFYIHIGIIVFVIGQFEGINPFRWVAWFNVSYGGLVLILTVLLFREKPLRCRESGDKTVRSRKQMESETESDADKVSEPSNCLKLKVPEMKKETGSDTNEATTEKKRCCTFRTATIIFLIVSGYVVESIYTIGDTIANPVLSDYFGFTTKYISYFFLLANTVYTLGSILNLVTERMKISTRLVSLFSLTMSTLGLLVLADWASLLYGSTVCSQYSLSEATSTEYICDFNSRCQFLGDDFINCDFSNSTVMLTLHSQPILTLNESCPVCSPLSSNCTSLAVENGAICQTSTELKLQPEEDMILFDVLNNQSICATEQFTENISDYCQDIVIDHVLAENNSTPTNKDDCLFYSAPPNYCYWNQESSVASSDCTECPPVCRSRRGSLHFAQVCIGVFFSVLSAFLGRWTHFQLMSIVTPHHIQEISQGFLVLFQSLGTMITPMWANTVYVATGRNTLIPCMIMIGCQIPVYIGFCVFYKQLTQKKWRELDNKLFCTNPMFEETQKKI